MINKSKKGFTLIELLIVIAIIAILAAIIFVAIDPAKRGGQARDAERWSEVNGVLNAVLKYGVDEDVSSFQTEMDIDSTEKQIVANGTTTGCDYLADGTTACTPVAATGDCLSLSDYLVDTYLSEMPQDPKHGTSTYTGYVISRTTGNRIKVEACVTGEDGGETISVAR